jgi:hypothetical protein
VCHGLCVSQHLYSGGWARARIKKIMLVKKNSKTMPREQLLLLSLHGYVYRGERHTLHDHTPAAAAGVWSLGGPLFIVLVGHGVGWVMSRCVALHHFLSSSGGWFVFGHVVFIWHVASGACSCHGLSIWGAQGLFIRSSLCGHPFHLFLLGCSSFCWL